MNKELLMVFLPGISWMLFALGGTQISDKIKGWKGWRRYILPFVYFLFCLSVGYVWKAFGVVGIAIGVYTLGYGIKKPYWYKFLVGLGYGLISVPIGLSWWNLVTVLGFISLFKLSNTKLTANMFVWKICEGFFGLFVGIELAYILMGNGLIW